MRAVGLGLAVVLIDWATKWGAVQAAAGGDVWPITPRRNEEMALGIVAIDGMTPAVIAVVVVAFIVFMHAGLLASKEIMRPEVFFVGLAGVTGNAVDRATTGAVHDFFSIGLAVVNVADVAIVVFLGAYVLVVWDLGEPDRRGAKS